MKGASNSLAFYRQSCLSGEEKVLAPDPLSLPLLGKSRRVEEIDYDNSVLMFLYVMTT